MFLGNVSILDLVKLKKSFETFHKMFYSLFLTSFANFEVTVSFVRTIQVM